MMVYLQLYSGRQIHKPQVPSVRISEIDILSPHLVGIEPEEDVPGI